jgi:hypothetical protein
VVPRSKPAGLRWPTGLRCRTGLAVGGAAVQQTPVAIEQSAIPSGRSVLIIGHAGGFHPRRVRTFAQANLRGLEAAELQIQFGAHWVPSNEAAQVQAGRAIPVLDGFYIRKQLGEAIDDVRAAEVKLLAADNPLRLASPLAAQCTARRLGR